jgi:two-component system sensor histidine kinase DesK
VSAVRTSAAAVGGPTWRPRRVPWFLVALILPFVAAGPVMAVPREHLRGGAAAAVVLVAVAIGALQLRHSLAVARGERPAGGLWTLLALAALVYVPLWSFPWNWFVMQWFVVASAAMVLRGRLAAVVAAAPLVGTAAVVALLYAAEDGMDAGLLLVVVGYQVTLLAMGGVALYGSARLVRVLDDLSAARTELAELAVGRERLRVARDLHDLLGQSLSAVSLKGDLALRLLPTDAAAARAEIESLTGLARDTLRDVRAVAHDEHAVSLPDEIEAAAALLGAAGVAPRVDVDLPGLARAAEEVLAWAVREGATNALRHSEATTWSLAGRRRAGAVTLEMVNDGVPSPADGCAAAGTAEGGDRDGGSGLAGLRSRVRTVAGSVSAGPVPGGRFRLAVEVPERAR